MHLSHKEFDFLLASRVTAYRLHWQHSFTVLLFIKLFHLVENFHFSGINTIIIWYLWHGAHFYKVMIYGV